MKKIAIFSLVVLLGGCVADNAQYKFDKYKYDFKSYTPVLGDPYNPGVCAICSFSLPGLGQIVANESGRGLSFMGGYFGSTIVTIVGANLLMSSSYYSDNNDIGVGMFLGGSLAALGVHVWSIVDAVRVAKVNNMAWRDHFLNPVQMSPSVSYTPEGTMVPSLSARIIF